MTTSRKRALFADDWKSPWAFHPFIVWSYCVVSAVTTNPGLTSVDVALVSLVGLAAVAASLAVLAKVLNRWHHAALVVTPATLLVVSAATLTSAVAMLVPALGRLQIVVPTSAGVLAAAALWLRRRRASHRGLSKWVTWYTVGLLVWQVLLPDTSLRVSHEEQPDSFHSAGGRHLARITLGYRPDVYYLVTDSYTSTQSLARYWRYDNSGFEAALAARGFVIAADARSSYDATPWSIASALNMTDGIPGTLPLLDVYRLIENNLVMSRFVREGYGIRNLSLFFTDFDRSRPIWPVYPLAISDYDRSRGISRTFWSGIFMFPGSLPASGALRVSARWVTSAEYDQRVFGAIAGYAASGSRKPHFIYAHLYVPHEPYYIDRTGRPMPVASAKAAKDAYLDQLIGTNVQLLRCVDDILKRYSNDNMPLIIIQGDHGFRRLTDPEDAARERFSVLNAYLLPGGGSRMVQASMAPHESFRALFDAYF